MSAAALDLRTAQTTLENAIRDALLYGLGTRQTVASVAALRALATRLETGSKMGPDDLASIVVSNVTTASYRWAPRSTATDNGTTVIRPADVASGDPGRWLAWTSVLRFAADVGGDAAYLHELQGGPVRRVVLLDKRFDLKEIVGLIAGETPAILIVAMGDSPEGMGLNSGHRWDTAFAFEVTSIEQSYRDYREAAQGSTLEAVSGANAIDGWVQTLLGGTQLQQAVGGVRDVQLGHGENWTSTEAQRRVMRTRSITIRATVQHPNAPNDTIVPDEVDAQQSMADLGDPADAWDEADFIGSGLTVRGGPGLAKTVAAGTATIAGLVVTYAGELHNFGANVDTYRDLTPAGAMVFLEVVQGDDPAAPAAGNLRIGITRTDSGQVLSDRLIARSRIAYGNPVVTPLT